MMSIGKPLRMMSRKWISKVSSQCPGDVISTHLERSPDTLVTWNDWQLLGDVGWRDPFKYDLLILEQTLGMFCGLAGICKIDHWRMYWNSDWHKKAACENLKAWTKIQMLKHYSRGSFLRLYDYSTLWYTCDKLTWRKDFLELLTRVGLAHWAEWAGRCVFKELQWNCDSHSQTWLSVMITRVQHFN